MTYNPIFTHDKLRKEVLADHEARAMYEAFKLQIKLSLVQKNMSKKRYLKQEELFYNT